MSRFSLYGLVFLLGASFCYEYAIKTFEVPLDHFGFSVNKSFHIRYLINDTHWKSNSGPIFFYTGNEGDIELFANNTGFMWEIAPTFKALLVFAEHRYYGKSLPFGNQSFADPAHLGYLSSQQALADFVDLITYLNGNQSKPYVNPVIAFGGSYGGMLAAYIRMKYPHAVTGAIAASAPIWQFTGMTPCDAFTRIVTADFEEYKIAGESCAKKIRNSWKAMNNLTSKDDGLKWLSTEWKLCRPLKNASDVSELKDWLTEVYTNLAMVNYPYPVNFLADLPAYPIREFCGRLQNSSGTDEDLLKKLFQGVSVYFNYTGDKKCLDFGSSFSSSLGSAGWDFQSCTEMVMPICQTGDTDMFEPQKWDLAKFRENCEKVWKVTPQPYLMEKVYGGKRIDTASNIMFSNGLLDPWTSGGVLKAPSKKISVFLIPEAAHHLDLRESNPADPPSVREVRLLHQTLIQKWIKEYEKKFLRF